MRRILNTFQGDKSIWIIVTLLALFSAMIVYSSTSLLMMKSEKVFNSFFIKHMLIIGVAYFFMWFMHNISYQYYSNLYKILLPLSVLMLLYVSFFGESVNEAKRWIRLPIVDLTLQPSDVAKFALVLYLARHMTVYKNEITNFKKVLLPMLSVVFLIVGLIFLENISTAVMVLVIAFTMMFVGRVSILQFAGILLVMVLLGGMMVSYIMFAPDAMLFKRMKTGKSRIESFVDGQKDFREVQYQVKHSNLAIARGGIIPKGPGNSIQKNFLPNAFSDYVFAIFIEEWGMLGGIFLIFLYMALLFRIAIIVVKSSHTYGALLALGLGLNIVIQAFFNMGVTVGILPSTGVTLPFVSMGGSSIIFIAMSFGIILSVSRAEQREELGEEPKKENYLDEINWQLNLDTNGK